MLVLQRTGVQFPAPYMVAHSNFGSRGFGALFWLPWALHASGAQAYRPNTH